MANSGSKDWQASALLALVSGDGLFSPGGPQALVYRRHQVNNQLEKALRAAKEAIEKEYYEILEPLASGLQDAADNLACDLPLNRESLVDAVSEEQLLEAVVAERFLFGELFEWTLLRTRS
jgi:hypothetical protein